jgi:hypothetical protein
MEQAQAKNSAGDKTVTIKFSKGSSSARYNGHIQSSDVHIYKFKAHAGQKIGLDLATSHYALFLSLYDVTGDAGLANEADTPWSGILPTEGAYEITVALMRSAARRDEAADYKLTLVVG